jgi:hypothetical protein
MSINFHILSISLLVAGCVGSTVDHFDEPVQFRQLRSAGEIGGTFNNHGTSQGDGWRPLLTEVLIPDSRLAAEAERVVIVPCRDGVLRCEAWRAGRLLGSRELVEGRDFHLVAGGLEMARGMPEPVLGAAGVGVGTDRSVLRLTRRGDLFLASHSKGAGMMLFVVPMAVSRDQEVLYARVGTRGR